MDPASLIPIPDALPVHWGWFQFLLLLTLLCHILLMNVMFGTTFIAMIISLREKGSWNPCTEAVSRTLPYTIALTINFGVAPLLFVQVLYGHLLYASSILMAVFWLSVVGLLGVVYALAYLHKYQYGSLGRIRMLVAGLIPLILLAIAFIYVNNFSLMQNPPGWTRYFSNPHGLLLHLEDPMLWPRFLHFMVGAVAVGGLAIALWFHRRWTHGDPSAQYWVSYGCRWFSFATLCNMAIGLWLLASSPEGTLTLSTTTGQFLLLTLGGGIVLSLPAILYGFAGRVVAAVTCTLGAISLMLLARSLLRTTLLTPWFSMAQLPTASSPVPLFYFLFLLGAGLALIIWLIRFTLRSCSKNEAHP